MPDPYLTAADIRARFPAALSDDTTYPDELLEAKVARFEALAETYRGTAFVEREFTDVVDVPLHSCWKIEVHQPHVLSVSSVTYWDGTTADLANIKADGRRLYFSDGAWFTPGKTTIVYTAGYTSPPAAVLDACYEFVRAEVLATVGDQPRNTLSYSSGDWTYREATADIAAGRPTKWIVVNDALNEVPDERKWVA